MKINSFIEELRKLVSQNKLEIVIQKLSHLLRNSKLLDNVIIQSARYNDIKNQVRVGVVDFEKAEITKNRIRLAVLDLIQEIEGYIESDFKIKDEVENVIQRPQNIIINNNDNGAISAEGKIVMKGDYLAGRDLTINNNSK